MRQRGGSWHLKDHPDKNPDWSIIFKESLFHLLSLFENNRSSSFNRLQQHLCIFDDHLPSVWRLRHVILVYFISPFFCSSTMMAQLCLHYHCKSKSCIRGAVEIRFHVQTPHSEERASLVLYWSTFMSVLQTLCHHDGGRSCPVVIFTFFRSRLTLQKRIKTNGSENIRVSPETNVFLLSVRPNPADRLFDHWLTVKLRLTANVWVIFPDCYSFFFLEFDLIPQKSSCLKLRNKRRHFFCCCWSESTLILIVMTVGGEAPHP